MIVYLLYFLVHSCFWREDLKFPNPPNVVLNGFLKVFIYSFIPLVYGCLNLLLCIQIGDTKYLAAAPSLNCFDSSRTSWVMLLLLWNTLVIPLYLIRLLKKHEKELDKNETIRDKYGSFYYIYKSEFYWFGFINLLTNTLLIIITLTLMEWLIWKIFLQYCFILFITFIYLYFYPYKLESDNKWEFFSWFSLFFLALNENASLNGEIHPPIFHWNIYSILQISLACILGAHLLWVIGNDVLNFLRNYCWSNCCLRCCPHCCLPTNVNPGNV